MKPDDWILETRGLTREFSGFVAVDGVDLRVRRGSIHALIGPNGAGKTTCFNLLTKFLKPTSGEIVFNGRDITGLGSAQIANLGVVRSFQISAIFPNLSVLENVRVALQRHTGTSWKFWQSEKNLQQLDQKVYDLLSQVGLESYAKTMAVDLPYGQKRSLEMATTLALDPGLLLLDEPTQGMGHEDVERVVELIRQVAKERTVLMVEHNMKVVAGLSDRITVLARGAVLAEGRYEEVSKNPRVIEAYLGTSESDESTQGGVVA